MFTAKQIREMPMGTELDELVCKLIYSPPSLIPSYVNESGYWMALRRFCEIHGAHWCLHSANKNGDYSCDIYRNEETSEYDGEEFGSIAALAICRAIVLAAMRWETIQMKPVDDNSSQPTHEHYKLARELEQSLCDAFFAERCSAKNPQKTVEEIHIPMIAEALCAAETRGMVKS